MALIMSVKAGDPAQFSRILSVSPNYPIDEEDMNGETALHWASRFGLTAMVSELIKVKPVKYFISNHWIIFFISFKYIYSERSQR